MNKALGRLRPVDLRTVWTKEASDFTPWLAEEENLTLLGETLGLRLELESVEKDVGSFRADILCKDAINDVWVLIENQLEESDHTHLGQLLTYTAGLDAVIIIWITRRFTEEHRAAMDWLNEKTGDEINFFGLEIELWRIGESLEAPKFNVASRPNGWRKRTISARDRAGLSDLQSLQLEFWTDLSFRLRDSNSIVQPRKPGPRNYMRFSIGHTNFHLYSSTHSTKHSLGVGFTVKANPERLAYYTLLSRHQQDIESNINGSFRWGEPWGFQITGPRYDPSDRKNWNDMSDWIITTLESVCHAVLPVLDEMDLEDYSPDLLDS